MQIIDVRDLAEWLVVLIERGATGVFNATGPRELLSMHRLLEACRGCAEANLIWVDEAFLQARDVAPLPDLPMWLPSSCNAFFLIASARAQESGLAYRPLEQTAEDVLRWDAERGCPEPMRAGLSACRERELLSQWVRHRGSSHAIAGRGE